MGGVCRQMTAGVLKVPVLVHGGLPSDAVPNHTKSYLHLHTWPHKSSLPTHVMSRQIVLHSCGASAVMAGLACGHAVGV